MFDLIKKFFELPDLYNRQTKWLFAGGRVIQRELIQGKHPHTQYGIIYLPIDDYWLDTRSMFNERYTNGQLFDSKKEAIKYALNSIDYDIERLTQLKSDLENDNTN